MSKTTKGPKGSGSIRQRPDGRWEARYSCGRDPGTGRQVQKSVYGRSQTEVRKKLQAICVSLDEGVYAAPVKYTLGQWLDTWLSDYLPDVKPATRVSYESHTRLHIKPALGAVKLSSLSTAQIQAFYNRLGKGTNGAPALSPDSIKNIHGVLHRALVQAVEMGFLKINPSDACRLPRVEKPDIKPLDDTAVSDFLKAIKGHRYETLFIVDLFTGLREGEVLGLTWDCIDFQNGSIEVYRQLQWIKGESGKGAYEFISLKNNKRRLITPAPSVMRLLQEHKRVQNEWRLKAGSAWIGNSDNNEPAPYADLVFTNEIGMPIMRNTMLYHFKLIVKSIGLPETRFHDLRHSYAVMSLQSGDDVKTVQDNLGHFSAAFTLDVYGHVTERMKRESAARMEQYIKGVQTDNKS